MHRLNVFQHSLGSCRNIGKSTLIGSFTRCISLHLSKTGGKQKSFSAENRNSLIPRLTLMGFLSKVEVFGFALSLFFMTLAALVMNFLVCLVVYRSKELRRHISSVFIVNLAICDFLIAVFAMPYSFGAVLADEWPFGRFWCQTSAFWNMVLGLAAVLTLATISADRYIAVCKPLQYRAKMTVQCALVMISLVWLQSIVFSLVPIGFGWYEFNPRYFFCTFPSDLHQLNYRVFTAAMYAANAGLSLLVMLVTYYRIFNVAKLHSRRIGHAVITAVHFAPVRGPMATETSRQREFKAARKILFVIGAFLCCLAPYTTLRILELGSKGISLSHASTITLRWIAFLKSAIDPFIYGLLQRRFRRSLLELFLGTQRAHLARGSLPCGPIRLNVRAKRQSSQSETGTFVTVTTKRTSIEE